jgi:hypothetical protein
MELGLEPVNLPNTHLLPFHLLLYVADTLTYLPSLSLCLSGSK